MERKNNLLSAFKVFRRNVILARYIFTYRPLIVLALVCGFILLLAQVASLNRQQAMGNLQQITLAGINRYMLSL